MNQHVNLALLQLGSTPIGAALPRPTKLIFNRPINGLLPPMHREHINIKHNDVQYKALKACQSEHARNNDAFKDPFVFSVGSTAAVWHEDRGPWMYGIIEEANASHHRGEYTSSYSQRQAD